MDIELRHRRAADTARLLRALANPHRLLILCRLMERGECSAGELATELELSPSTLSQHLTRMREEDLVAFRREARTLFYRLGGARGARLPELLQGICEDASTDPGDASMNRMTRTAAILGLAVAGITGARAADGFWSHPAIRDAGRMHALPDAAYQPDRAATYKVVFALTRGSDDPAQINPALQRVARTVNLYASAGVPLQHLKFVAVASGAATTMALDDAHYRTLYGTANPNLAVIVELREAGVDVAVCGQAVAEHHFAYDAVDRHVTVALSALTTITELQQRGYALMPL